MSNTNSTPVALAKYCEKCGKENKASALFCSNCTEKLPLAVPPVTAAPYVKASQSTQSVEHDGTECKKCQIVYLEIVERCSKCGSATVPSKWYTRFRTERVAFIGTLSLAAVLITLAVNDDQQAVLVVGLLTPVFLFSMYFTANYLFGIGGGFSERFGNGNMPPWAHEGFSWRCYLSETLQFLVVAAVILLFVAGVSLFKWLFHSGR